MERFSDAELISFMEEGLCPEEMARVEAALRDSSSLRHRLAALRQTLDRGWHSIGAIWRSHRISCPTRSQLGSFLLDALDPQWQDYIRFHVEVVSCRVCLANLADLEAREGEGSSDVTERRRRLFQSSVGHLRPGGRLRRG